MKTTNTVSYNDLFFSKTNDYLNNYIAHQTGQSPHTRIQYKTGLSKFYDYINKKNLSVMKFRFSDCSLQLLLDYIQFLLESEKLKPSTINVRITAIREYLKYASDCDIDILPVYMIACKLPTLTVPHVFRPIIEKKDLAGFLDSPKHTRIGNRDRFILILLYDSAIRVQEMVSLSLGDITITGNDVSILIKGKGRKERCIELSEKAAKQAIAYLNEYHTKPWNPEAPLFFTTIHGIVNRMSIRNVQRILKKYGKISKQTSDSIPDNVYPHMLRRTRATSLYRDNVPIEQISALLGHSDIETTREHYAQPSDEQLKEMMSRAVKEEPDSSEHLDIDVDKIKSKFGLA